MRLSAGTRRVRLGLHPSRLEGIVTNEPQDRLSAEELAAEGATPLPDKEVMSLLDLNANLDLALDAAAPIDLAVGANANIAAPIDAAVNANVLSPDALSSASATQQAALHQGIVGDATANSTQGSTIDQGAAPGDSSAGSVDPTGDSTTTSVGDLGDGNLLNVNVDLNGDLNLAAPIDGAVAANANAAVPIDAAVSANIGSPGATSVAEANQAVVIDQSITGDATANANQSSAIDQGGTGGSTTP
jgi:hypothetical protein